MVPAALLVAYVAYPYLTLYWLDRAVLTGNTAILESLIDWPQVRQQLKADVKLALIESAQTQVGKGNFAGIFGGALTASWRDGGRQRRGRMGHPREARE
jgi:Protein of unknown function (DUF2939)